MIPLPKGLVPIEDCAYAAMLPERELHKALLATSVPLYQIRVGNRTQTYARKSAFDRWFVGKLGRAEAAA